MNAPDSTSTRPYLIRALYEWCTDNGLTPYVAVAVDDSVQVPREYVKNHEIVLNISFDATSSLKLGNDFIEFKARFAGSARDILVPISCVIAIYARENGQGMAFPMPGVVPGGTALPLNLSGSDNGRSDAGTPVAPSHATSQLVPVPGSPPSAFVQQVKSSAGDSKVMQLVPSESSGSAADNENDQPDPPKPQQGGRPSLKRVK
jgi:stringent starvation protein B